MRGRWPQAVVGLLILSLAACSPARLTEAARLLADVAAGPGPSALKETTPSPRRIPVRYAVDGRWHGADLYLPPEGYGARLVIVPGAAEAGKDDPRLVAFAESFARARFAVLVPDIGRLRALQVSAGDARDIADALRWLSAQEGGPDGAGVGLAAISYAVGPAVLAALDPAVAPHLRFLLGVGGYYDITAAIAFVTTGWYREPDGEWRRREPNAYGKWLFVLGNAGRLRDPEDAGILREMAERRLADPAADLADLMVRLGPEGRAVMDLLANADPARVPALIAALPESIRAEIAALDLSRRDLSRLHARLHARLYLVHGRDDSIIPYTESVALAAAAPDAELYLVDGLMHVDMAPGLGDSLTLLAAAYALLLERDRMAE